MKLLKRWAVCLMLSLMFAGFVQGRVVEAQGNAPDSFGAKNTFGVLGEYSNDSSRIIIGSTDNEKFGAIGLTYQRRLYSNDHLIFSYAAEFRPVIIESNPASSGYTVQTSPTAKTLPPSSGPTLTTKCVTRTLPYKYEDSQTGIVYAGTVFLTCDRVTTFSQSLSPIGFRLNLRPHHALEPTFSTYEGYKFSTRKLPVDSAGSFNFVFEFGAGIEYYRSANRSIRLEYQIQHYSNAFSADSNPGVDNGMFKVTYTFGR